MPANVDSTGVDFSDRVDGKRKSYKASSRRQRILQDGTQELGDLSDDEDDDESLERRIARLKREVEEAKEEQARRRAAAAATTTAAATTDRDDTAPDVGTLDSLSRVLEEMSRPISTVRPSTRPRGTTPAPDAEEDAEAPAGQDATYTITYAPTYDQSHALAKTADFDRRLLMIEKGLGINASSIPEAGSDGLARAILPTLDSLEKQISTLSQATTVNLDAISRRVRNLATEQQKLNETKEKTKTLREELGKSAPAPAGDDSEQDAKVNALYGILPTIESLTPVLPPLLDRLRSLRAIHADAATASETLARIEREQTEMTAELKQWRTGLETMESTMAKGDDTVKGNMQVMEGWIKDLEERMDQLK
jgi:nuclear migration protein JNM1